MTECQRRTLYKRSGEKVWDWKVVRVAELAHGISSRDIRCAHCHGNAADFARRSLTLRDGALVGLPSGRRVVDTLGTHGGAKPGEVPVLLDTLARVHSEVAPSRP